MLVDVCQSLPERASSASALADPGITLAMQNFRAAIDSQTSLFIGDARSVIAGISAPTACFCSGDFVLRFRREELAAQEALYLSLLEKLTELLKAAGAEWLTARLCLQAQPGRSVPALALLIRLEARGASQEQANLRWCLGAAHLQQALLFTSRYLRQQSGQ
jgi:hypothetical protein